MMAALAWRGWWQRHRWLRFLLVGGLNTAFGYCMYALLLFLGLNFALANLLALLAGIVFSFRTHSGLVFLRHDWRRFLRYLLSWAAIYLLNTGIIALLLQCGISAYVAGLITIVPGALLSYLAQRHFVFRAS